MKDRYFNQHYRRSRWWLAAGMGLALLTGPAVSWAADVTANVTKVSVMPSTPLAATATAGGIQVIFELNTPSVIGDTITYTLTGTAVSGTSYTAPAAPFATTVAGTGHVLAVDTLVGSVAAETFIVTANAIPSNTATFTALVSGGLATASSGSIEVSDAGTLINDGETQPKLIGETVAGTAVLKTLTVKNTGSSPLVFTPLAPATTAISCTVGGAVEPKFTIVDPDLTAAPDFTSAAFTIPANGSSDFQVQFLPPVGTPAGNYDCVLNITSSATNILGAPPVSFDFAVRGIVLAAPPAGQAEIDVLDGTTELVDNTATAIILPDATAGGTMVEKIFTIQNPGTGDLSVTSLTFSPASPYFMRVDPYPSMVPAGGSATFTIRFDPASAQPGVYDTEVVIDSTDSAFQEGIENPFNFPVSITVTGVGPAADIQVWEETLGTIEVFDGVAPTTPFPMTFAGTPVSRNFVITNIGTADLDLNALSIGGLNASNFSWAPVTSPFPDFLAPSATATFKVTFTPPAVGGYNAYLQIFNNSILNNENPFDILLSGTAMSATKEIEVFDGTVNIAKGTTINLTTAPGGVVGTPITKTFTIQNIGGTALKIDSLQFSTGGTGLKLSSLAATTLDAAGGAKDKVEFTVTLEAATAGEFTGTVSIANDDTDENPFTFVVTGTILSSLTTPEVTVWEVLDDASLDEIFDEQTDIVDFSAAINTPVTKTFKVKNIGGVALDLTALSPLPKGFSLVGVFPTKVLPGQTVDFQIKLDTSAVANYGGTLEFYSTDVDENPFSFPIGASVDVPAPEIDVLDGTISVANGTAVPVTFGPTGIGNSVSKIFTIKNIGEADLNLTTPASFKEGGTGFTINSFNPGPVAKGGFTSFTVTLNASTAGTYTGTVTFGNDDKDENPYTFPVSGTVDSTPPTTEEIEVWDGSPADITAGTAIQIPDGDTNKVDFGTTPVGTPSIQTFTVKNLGSEVLTLYSLRLPVGYELQKGVTLSTVAPQQQVSFDVILNGTTDGVYEGSLELFNSDVDETPYDFPLTGKVGNPVVDPPVDVAALTISRNGNGLVESADGQLSCGTNAAQCEYTYTLGTAVTLTATPDAGSEFKDWTGGCTGTENPVIVTVDAAKTCTATFFVPVQQVNLTFTAPQNGTVITDVGGIDCGSACTATFASGDRVTVTATAADGYTFSAWSGDCSGHGATNPINLTLTETLECAATFASTAPESVAVSVTKPDNGTLSTADGKIDCGNLCSASYTVGETLTLTANSASAQFDSWTGDCAGQGNPATLTVSTTPLSCQAVFKNIPSIEGDCFEQGLGVLMGGDKCEAATLSTAESSTGNPGTAAMRMGISKFNGVYKQQDTVTLIDPIKTAGAIRVDTADIGQAADILVIGRHDWDMYPEGMAWYMMMAYPQSPLGWTIGILPFDPATEAPNLTEAAALETVDSLPAYYTVYMYSGNFVYPGPLKIWFGYRVQSTGKVVMSVDPIDVTILPTPTN